VGRRSRETRIARLSGEKATTMNEQFEPGMRVYYLPNPSFQFSYLSVHILQVFDDIATIVVTDQRDDNPIAAGNYEVYQVSVHSLHHIKR
jgi:hypothetical protein